MRNAFVRAWSIRPEPSMPTSLMHYALRITHYVLTFSSLVLAPQVVYTDFEDVFDHAVGVFQGIDFGAGGIVPRDGHLFNLVTPFEAQVEHFYVEARDHGAF